MGHSRKYKSIFLIIFFPNFINSRLKSTLIKILNKAFCRQRLPQCSSAGKETVDLDILNTAYQNNQWTSHKNQEVEPVHPVQRKICQIYIDAASVRPTVLMAVSVAYPTYSSSSSAWACSNKLYGPYLWVGFNSLKAAIMSRHLTKLHKVLMSLRWLSSKTKAVLSTSPSHGFLREN